MLFRETTVFLQVYAAPSSKTKHKLEAGKAEGRTALLLMRYTYVTFFTVSMLLSVLEIV